MIHLNKTIGLVVISKKLNKGNFTEDDKEFVSIITPQLAGGIKIANTYSESQEQIKRQRDALIFRGEIMPLNICKHSNNSLEYN